MARADLRDTAIRRALETIAGELAIVTDACPVAKLRIEQACHRTGLTSLLAPAANELDDIAQAITVAQVQVRGALAVLTEKQ